MNHPRREDHARRGSSSAFDSSAKEAGGGVARPSTRSPPRLSPNQDPESDPPQRSILELKPRSHIFTARFTRFQTAVDKGGVSLPLKPLNRTLHKPVSHPMPAFVILHCHVVAEIPQCLRRCFRVGKRDPLVITRMHDQDG